MHPSWSNGVSFLVPYHYYADGKCIVCLDDIEGLDYYHTHSYVNYREWRMVPLGDRVTLSIPYMLALPDTYSVT